MLTFKLVLEDVLYVDDRGDHLEVGVSLPEQQDVLVVGDDPLVGDDQPLELTKDEPPLSGSLLL